MAIDIYSPCPGGTGKKIKFCCSDNLSDLQKLDRMIEGEQYAACLQQTTLMEKKTPGRACLLATKALLLRTLGKADEYAACVAEFLDAHPENPMAQAEAAVRALASQHAKAALLHIEKALALSTKEMAGRVYEAVRLTAVQMLTEGHYSSARALAYHLGTLFPNDRTSVELIVRLNAAPMVPPILKEDRLLDTCPSDAPYAKAFGDGLAAASSGRWSEAERIFAELGRDHPEIAVIWRNLAIVRSWLAEAESSSDAWRHYATLDVPLEDAVEAQVLAWMLSEDNELDKTTVANLTYPVKDFDQLQAALLSAPVAKSVPFDPAAVAEEGHPAPKHIFLLLDRETPEKETPLAWQSVPCMLGQALLYGNETDRQARLEVRNVFADDRDAVHQQVLSLGQEALDPDFTEEDVTSLPRDAALVNPRWLIPEYVADDEAERLTDERLAQVLRKTWATTPAAALDGKTPAEAAQDETLRVTVLALIMNLTLLIEPETTDYDFNTLRAELGLPTLDPIELGEEDLIAMVPLSRLHRVVREKLSDDAVILGYRRAVTYAISPASRMFAAELASRESLAKHPDLGRALQILATSADSPDEGLGHVKRGRETVPEERVGCQTWDLMEISLRFVQGDGPAVMRLIQHYQTKHMQEPGAAEALARSLVEMGALRPDGSLALPSSAPQQATDSPSLVVPGQADAPAEGGLWTPDGTQPSEKKSGIWTPDMD